MVKNVHLKKLDIVQCLIDPGLKWIYANVHTIHLMNYTLLKISIATKNHFNNIILIWAFLLCKRSLFSERGYGAQLPLRESLQGDSALGLGPFVFYDV